MKGYKWLWPQRHDRGDPSHGECSRGSGEYRWGRKCHVIARYSCEQSYLFRPIFPPRPVRRDSKLFSHGSQGTSVGKLQPRNAPRLKQKFQGTAMNKGNLTVRRRMTFTSTFLLHTQPHRTIRAKSLFYRVDVHSYSYFLNPYPITEDHSK